MSIQPNGDDIDTLTQRFRHEILQLSVQIPCEPSWQVAQHVLSSLANTSDNDNKVKSAHVINLCPDCGSSLQPGHGNTSLSVQRCSRRKKATLRRRVQREQAATKRVGAKPLASATAATTHESKRVILHDDPRLVLERHHLVLTCGHCHGKIRLSSKLKRDVPLAKSQRKAPPSYLKPAAPVQGKPASAGGPSRGDFIQLPTTPKSKAKKPKKKPQQQKRPNQLMQFLSSLND
eukprot:Nitzschia sp. Nitz4//scaffold15_size197535//155995//156693//NITZ4_001599-RA/size197535-processed-gene-0.28-mRNA-1//1//CDS//3329537778//5451//frame0